MFDEILAPDGHLRTRSREHKGRSSAARAPVKCRSGVCRAALGTRHGTSPARTSRGVALLTPRPGIPMATIHGLTRRAGPPLRMPPLGATSGRQARDDASPRVATTIEAYQPLSGSAMPDRNTRRIGWAQRLREPGFLRVRLAHASLVPHLRPPPILPLVANMVCLGVVRLAAAHDFAVQPTPTSGDASTLAPRIADPGLADSTMHSSRACLLAAHTHGNVARGAVLREDFAAMPPVPPMMSTSLPFCKHREHTHTHTHHRLCHAHQTRGRLRSRNVRPPPPTKPEQQCE